MVWCGSLGDTFNLPILSPQPCLQALPASLALLGVVNRTGEQVFPGQRACGRFGYMCPCSLCPRSDIREGPVKPSFPSGLRCPFSSSTFVPCYSSLGQLYELCTRCMAPANSGKTHRGRQQWTAIRDGLFLWAERLARPVSL